MQRVVSGGEGTVLEIKCILSGVFMVSFRLNVWVILITKKRLFQIGLFKHKINDVPSPDFATVLCYNFVGPPGREITQKVQKKDQNKNIGVMDFCQTKSYITSHCKMCLWMVIIYEVF